MFILMIKIFIIIIILILFYFLLKNKDYFSNKKIIKGNEVAHLHISYENASINIGKNVEQVFITYNTRFYLKINVPKTNVDRDHLGLSTNDCKEGPNWRLPNGKCCSSIFKDSDSCINDYIEKTDDNYYLNNGTMCPSQISTSKCFNKSENKSNIITDVLLLKGIPEVKDCIESGCIPEGKNDDYCCSKMSTKNNKCKKISKKYQQKSCIPTLLNKKADGVCLNNDETKYNCKSHISTKGTWAKRRCGEKAGYSTLKCSGPAHWRKADGTCCVKGTKKADCLKEFNQSKPYYSLQSGEICGDKTDDKKDLSNIQTIMATSEDEYELKEEEAAEAIEEENLKKSINETTQSGLWKFFDIERHSNPEDEKTNTNLVYYGHELLITNIGSTISYLCICDDPIDKIEKCGNKVDIYCYNDIADAKKNGRWILIPKFFNKFRHNGQVKITNIHKDIDGNYIDYDFYDDHKADYYDFDTLKNMKIPIKNTDKFLIINTKKVRNKYVYLNFCGNDNRNLSLTCDDITHKKIVGTFSNNTQLSKFDDDMHVYNWSIVPTIYDINVYDTLFIDGSIKLGDHETEEPIEITTDTLRYIKSIPYHFKDKICLQDENKMTTCINKEHIEILNGSRPINVKSVVSAKPFILYSGANYTGRELRIGFDYEYPNKLPYIGDYNEWLNPNDHGKWKSLKIEGPYSVIIFNKTNYGHDDKPIEELETKTKEEILAIIEENAQNNTNNTNNNNNNNNTNTISMNNVLHKNSVNKFVNSPGIKNINEFGDDWDDGIKSIIFRYKTESGEYKEISSASKSFELKCLEKEQLTNQPYKDKDDVVNTNIYTANLCKNGNNNQTFYLIGDNDDKYVDSDIYDNMDDNHLHFHKHPYDLVHTELEDIHDI